jgi:hypothetical protein
VCKNWHVEQPEVGINISLSDESDIIKFSVFCKSEKIDIKMTNLIKNEII